MVTLSRIYTKSGDKGKTGLGNGQRIHKSNARIEMIGRVDELNAALGECVYIAKQEPHLLEDIASIMTRIQNDLFDMGADVCVPCVNVQDTQNPNPLRMTKDHTLFLEECIDRLNAHLSPLTSFVLPGGSALSARLHVVRTLARRAERFAWTLEEESYNGEVAIYLNRLSDLFFVMARYANDCGKTDVLWVPGGGVQNTSSKETNSAKTEHVE